MIELAIGAMLVLGVGCAAFALVPQPRVWSPAPTLASSGQALTPIGGMRIGAVREFFTTLLSWFGRWMPRGKGSGVSQELAYTGVPLTTQQLAGLKILSAVVSAFISVTIAREFDQLNSFVVAVLAGAFGFILPNLWLKARIQKRQRRIVRLLPEVIDLLALCIGAGLDFLGALNKVVMLKSFKHEPLVQELSVVLQEIKLGKRRFEALKAASKRVNVTEFSSFVRTLVQADRMGTPIAEVLSIHSEDVRFQRFTRAERAALKAPIKILMPLIFFIMPCVALIVGAPIFLQFAHQNVFGK